MSRIDTHHHAIPADYLKALRKAGRSTVANLVAGSSTDDAYRSLVVLANPKTILNDRYAKRDVKAQVIRADQLIETIRTHSDLSAAAARERALSLLAEVGIPAPEARLDMGVEEGMLRINIGLEDPRDVIADLDQALTKVGL